MYSIAAFKYSPNINKEPLQSASKPQGKAQIATLTIEAFVAAAITGVGLYILFHHGLNIHDVATLGTKAGYLFVAVPGGVVLTDYFIGSAIKDVKNKKALKKVKLLSKEAPASPVIQQSPPPAPPKIESKEPSRPEEAPSESKNKEEAAPAEVKQPEPNQAEIIKGLIESYNTERDELTKQQKSIQKQIVEIKRDQELATATVPDLLEGIERARKAILQLDNEVEKQQFLQNNLTSKSSDPVKMKKLEQKCIEDYIKEKTNHINSCQKQIQEANAKADQLKLVYNPLNEQFGDIKARIEFINDKVAQLNEKLKALPK